VPVGRGYVGAMIEENFRCATAAVGCRQYQWRRSKGSMKIHFGAAREEQLCDFGGIRNGSTMQGRITGSGAMVLRRVHASAML